jgi:hypothetical protein
MCRSVSLGHAHKPSFCASLCARVARNADSALVAQERLGAPAALDARPMNAVSSIGSRHRTSLSGDPARLLERDRRASCLRRRNENCLCRHLGARAPTSMGHDGPGGRLRAHPEADAAIVDANRRPRAPLEQREATRRDERTLRHAHGRNADDGAEMDSQPSPSGMVDPGRIHEQHVRKRRQPPDGHREHWAFPPRQEARRIGGRYPFGRHRLREDVIGLAGPPVGPRASQMTVDPSTTIV